MVRGRVNRVWSFRLLDRLEKREGRWQCLYRLMEGRGRGKKEEGKSREGTIGVRFDRDWK